MAAPMTADALAWRRLFEKDGRLRPILRVGVYLAAVWLCVAIVTLLVFSVWPSARRPGPANSVPVFVIGEIFGAAIVVGVALYLRRRLDRRSIASLGFGFGASWLRLRCFVRYTYMQAQRHLEVARICCVICNNRQPLSYPGG